MNRNSNLKKLEGGSRVWDLVIIGGGASGLGVALDGLSRGLSVALFEKADFAQGTSSRSTKLVHGGVRYLAQGEIGLVFEALRERGRLLRNAPHLTENQPFIIPVYTWFDRWKYAIGLKIYDWMAGRLRLGKSRFISREETISRIPQIRKEGLQGGIVYHDGQFDDARLALAIAQTCDRLGGCLFNHFPVLDLTKDPSGRVNGLVVKDGVTGVRYQVRAKAVVNATGVFADKILRMDEPGMRKTIQPSQGIHLVMDKSFLGGKDALMIPATSDGRVLFAVPWQEKLVVGTTDTLRERAKMEPRPLAKEINFILETASHYLDNPPTRKDVLSVFAGLRPLAAPKEGSQKTKEISRSHKIIVSKSGLITLTGGKWTTFRKMGEDTLEIVGRIASFALKPSTSVEIRLHGYSEKVEDGHWRCYGSDADQLRKLVVENPSWSRRLHEKYPYTEAEVIWAVREEMALKVDDVLSRRMRILILDAKAAIEMADRVAELMAEEMGKDMAWKVKELEDFNKLADKYQIDSL